MLEAERAGLQAMHEAGAIRVPRPICGGDGSGGKQALDSCSVVTRIVERSFLLVVFVDQQQYGALHSSS